MGRGPLALHLAMAMATRGAAWTRRGCAARIEELERRLAALERGTGGKQQRIAAALDAGGHPPEAFAAAV